MSNTGILEFVTIFVLAAFVGNEVIRQVPSIAAAAAKAGSIANARLSMTIASRMPSSVYW